MSSESPETNAKDMAFKAMFALKQSIAPLLDPKNEINHRHVVGIGAYSHGLQEVLASYRLHCEVGMKMLEKGGADKSQIDEASQAIQKLNSVMDICGCLAESEFNGHAVGGDGLLPESLFVNMAALAQEMSNIGVADSPLLSDLAGIFRMALREYDLMAAGMKISESNREMRPEEARALKFMVHGAPEGVDMESFVVGGGAHAMTAAEKQAAYEGALLRDPYHEAVTKMGVSGREEMRAIDALCVITNKACDALDKKVDGRPEGPSAGAGAGAEK